MSTEYEVFINSEYGNLVPPNRVIVKKTGIKVATGATSGPRGPRGFPGIENIADFIDVNFTNLENGDVMTYNASLQKWVNSPEETLVDGGNF